MRIVADPTCSRRVAFDDAVAMGRGAAIVAPRMSSGVMRSAPLLEALVAGDRRRRCPGFHRGRPPRNKGLRYPADPPTVEEIVAVMREAGDARRASATRR